MRMWVNKKTRKEGFTAAHFSALTGNIEVLNYLIAHGADIEIDSTNGLSLMHVAAQANQTAFMVFLLVILGLFEEEGDGSEWYG
jgi:ankyrin repeat protein